MSWNGPQVMYVRMPHEVTHSIDTKDTRFRFAIHCGCCHELYKAACQEGCDYCLGKAASMETDKLISAIGQTAMIDHDYTIAIYINEH